MDFGHMIPSNLWYFQTTDLTKYFWFLVFIKCAKNMLEYLARRKNFWKHILEILTARMILYLM